MILCHMTSLKVIKFPMTIITSPPLRVINIGHAFSKLNHLLTCMNILNK